jgi:hypothetical protein
MWRVSVCFHHRPPPPVHLTAPWRYCSLLHHIWGTCHPKIPGNKWKSLRAKSGLHAECSETSQPNCWSIACILAAACGCALSCRSITALGNRPRHRFWMARHNCLRVAQYASVLVAVPWEMNSTRRTLFQSQKSFGIINFLLILHTHKSCSNYAFGGESCLEQSQRTTEVEWSSIGMGCWPTRALCANGLYVLDKLRTNTEDRKIMLFLNRGFFFLICAN